MEVEFQEEQRGKNCRVIGSQESGVRPAARGACGRCGGVTNGSGAGWRDG